MPLDFIAFYLRYFGFNSFFLCASDPDLPQLWPKYIYIYISKYIHIYLCDLLKIHLTCVPPLTSYSARSLRFFFCYLYVFFFLLFSFLVYSCQLFGFCIFYGLWLSIICTCIWSRVLVPKCCTCCCCVSNNKRTTNTTYRVSHLSQY